MNRKGSRTVLRRGEGSNLFFLFDFIQLSWINIVSIGLSEGHICVTPILIQVAHAAAKKKDSVFFDFYEAKKDIIGKGKTVVALARKIITIVWHLIVNDEIYEDKYARPKKPQVN